MNDDAIAAFCARHGWSGPPEELMARLCADLLREAECRVPVDVRRLASFRGARVIEAEQQPAGLLQWDASRLTIRVRASDSEERRRFTVCHEVCHTFMPGFRQTPRTRADLDVECFDRRDPEEYLCDLGAAELLLPRADIAGLLRADFTIDDILILATHFRASIEATALRCVGLSPQPVAIVVLDRAPDSPQDGPAPPGSVYVRRAASVGLPEIAPGSVIAGEVPLSHVLDAGEMAYRGDAGLLAGTFAVSARSMPYVRAGQPVERALALLRPCVAL